MMSVYYLEYTGTRRPVLSVNRTDRFSCRPKIEIANGVKEARKFSRSSDALRCKCYWESNESLYELDPWGYVKQLFVIRECDA